MGLFENIFRKEKTEKLMQGYFSALTAYQPRFTTFEGGVYEMSLTRSAIHAFANSCSRLKPEVVGAGNEQLSQKLQYKPNPYQDTSKFLYRLATILAVNNTAFIAPIYARDMQTVVGYYPLLPEYCDLLEYNGEPYLRYQFGGGKHACVEYSRAGVLTQMQYRDDFFGATNGAMLPTLQLLSVQNQGIIESVKSSAAIRFLARLGQVYNDATLRAERQRFVENNLGADNNGGVMMFDAKYADVKQINSQAYVVDDKQMKLIQDNVFDYFGVNEAILTNKYTEDEWNAFYEGKIEPFALQLSLVMTNMTFSERERDGYGNAIFFSANRLQYASNSTKINLVTQLFDRGMITQNQALEIFNMPPVEDGDVRYIRGEYIPADEKGNNNK